MSNWVIKSGKKWASPHKKMMLKQSAPSLVTTKTPKARNQSRLPTRNQDRLLALDNRILSSQHLRLGIADLDLNQQMPADQLHEQQKVQSRQDAKSTKRSLISIWLIDNKKALLSRGKSHFKRKISMSLPRTPARQARKVVDLKTKINRSRVNLMRRSYYRKATRNTWCDKRF